MQNVSEQKLAAILVEPSVQRYLANNVNPGRRTHLMFRTQVLSLMEIFLMEVWLRRRTTVEIPIQFTTKVSGVIPWIHQWSGNLVTFLLAVMLFHLQLSCVFNFIALRYL